MAHELSIAADGRAEMAYAGPVPWHGLGQALTPDAPLDTWIQQAGMAWTVRGSAVRYADHTGCLRPFPGQKALWRGDTGAPLGVVSERYNVVQPREVLEFFGELVDGAGFKLETAGVLFGGRKYWALARICEDAAVRDPRDKVGGYLLLSTSADGSTVTEGRFTSVRVVCNNTLTAANRTAARAAYSHRQAWDPDAMRGMLGVGRDQLQDQFGQTMEQFRKLAERPLGYGEVYDLTMRLFDVEPDDLTTEGRRKFFALKAPASIASLAYGEGLYGCGLEGCAGTSWSWLNAVTQHADHEAKAKSQSHRLASAWWGDGADRKRRALDLALATLQPVATQSSR